MTALQDRTDSGRTVERLSESAISPRARARFWAKVDMSGGMFACWRWLGARDQAGYGRFGTGQHFGTNIAHRIAYLLKVGPIPEGMDIDHVKAWGCEFRDCVNPAHLEPVTHHENCRRGKQAQQTHCVNGHPFDSEHLVMRFRRDGTPYRQCKTCVRIRAARNEKAAVCAAANTHKSS